MNYDKKTYNLQKRESYSTKFIKWILKKLDLSLDGRIVLLWIKDNQYSQLYKYNFDLIKNSLFINAKTLFFIKHIFFISSSCCFHRFIKISYRLL